MISKFTILDVFGQPFSFRATKTSKTYSTIIGGVFTLLSVIFLILISLVILHRFLDTTKPVVSVNKIKLLRAPRLDLLKHQVGYGAGFYAMNDFLETSKLDRYLTIKIEMVITREKKGGGLVEEVKPLALVSCNETSNEHTKELASVGFNETGSTVNFNALFSKTTLCIDFNPEDWFIEGSRFSLPYRRFVAKFYPCSLEDPSQCVGSDELSTVLVGVVPKTKIANYSDKGNPLRHVIDADSILYLDVASKMVMTTYFKENYILDNDIDMVGYRKTNSYIDIGDIKSYFGSRLSGRTHCSKEEIESGQCESYLDMVYRSGFEKMVIERNYRKFFQSLSEIGGFWELIIFSLWAVYFMYNRWSYRRLIRSELVSNLAKLEGHRNNQLLRLKLKNKPTEKQRRAASLYRGKNNQTSSFSDPLEQLLNPQPEANNLLQLSFKSHILVSALKIDKKYHTLFERAILIQKTRKKYPKINTKNEEKLKAHNNLQKIINKLKPRKPPTTNRTRLSNFTSIQNHSPRKKMNPSLQEFISLSRGRNMGVKMGSMRKSLAAGRKRSVKKPNTNKLRFIDVEQVQPQQGCYEIGDQLSSSRNLVQNSRKIKITSSKRMKCGISLQDLAHEDTGKKSRRISRI